MLLSLNGAFPDRAELRISRAIGVKNSKVACLENVSKSFGEKLALKSISFDIFAREIFGYVGPNGAGKTTTIRLLTGLLRPNEGKVTVFGDDPYVSSSSRAKIGVVLDAPGLWENLTVYQNMKYFSAFFKDDAEKGIRECLKTVDLDANVNQKVYTLSKGMRQKLATARALVHDPDFLIFDEPTANLDPDAQRDIRELVLRLSKSGKTIFLSSHNLPEVQQLCGRVGIINKGTLLTVLNAETMRGRDLEKIYFETTRGERA
jgi:ABC-2 type transport system ATP-binding protein